MLIRNFFFLSRKKKFTIPSGNSAHIEFAFPKHIPREVLSIWNKVGTRFCGLKWKLKLVNGMIDPFFAFKWIKSSNSSSKIYASIEKEYFWVDENFHFKIKIGFHLFLHSIQSILFSVYKLNWGDLYLWFFWFSNEKISISFC